MLSARSHPPPPLAQNTVGRMQRQWWTSNSLGSQYGTVGMTAILSLQILINEVYSHLILPRDIAESEVHSSIVISA